MAFTFNFKEKNIKVLNNNKRINNKYNKSFETNKRKNEKVIAEKKGKIISYQKNYGNKYQKENDISNNRKINKNKKQNYDNNNNNLKHDNLNKIIKNNIRNNSQKEIKKNNRGIKYIPSNERRAISAKKNNESKNIERVNIKDDQKNMYRITNLKTFKSEYDKKRKEIVHSKVKKEINHIFQKLPENYEKNPVLNNKFELLMKNLDEFKYFLNRKKNKYLFSKK